MKKSILLAIALGAFSFTNAQVKFGVKAGVNLANINESYSGFAGEFDGDYKMKIGAHLGGFVEIKLAEKFALQPELLFSMQGAKYEEADFNDGAGVSSSYESTINLNYINVPVMVKFYPIPKLFIEAGPQVGFLISAKTKFEESGTDFDEDGNPYSYNESKSIDSKDYFKSIDFGMNIGVGYEFTEMIFANLRYNIGLSDISEAPDNVDFDFGLLGDVFKTRNNVLSASVGFKF